jgi:hypothetical protein
MDHRGSWKRRRSENLVNYVWDNMRATQCAKAGTRMLEIINCVSFCKLCRASLSLNCVQLIILRSVLYNRSTASSKASYPQTLMQCLVFQFPVSSLFLNFIQKLPTSSSSSSRPFYSLFNKVFQNSVSAQRVTNPFAMLIFITCRIFLSSLTLCNTSSLFTVKALRYKPAGRGFDSRWCQWIFH